MRRVSLEEVKKRKCGYDVWHDIERYAVSGYEAIEPADLELFKWYGIYEQRPRRGYFMVRLRVPGGRLSARQARCIAQAGRDFARGTLDITTRQCIQFHWVPFKDIPELIRRLHSVSLSTTAACGDTPRNIVACPLAGRRKGELTDVRSLTKQVDRRLAGNRLYGNLPRKFKISLCGCESQCTLPQLHDVSFYAARKGKGKSAVRGFNLLVGGGLSSNPRMAVPLDVFVPEEKVPETCEALCRIFAEKGPRELRTRSRMKFMVKEWTAPRLREELVEILGHDPDREVDALLKDGFFREPDPTGRQRQKGLNYISMVTTVGRLSPEDLFVAASAAEEFGSGSLCLTPLQNFLVPDIPDDKLGEAGDRLALAPTCHLEASHLRIGTLACTGFDYCEKANVETKGLASACVDQLEKAGTEPAVPIKIAFSGCSSDCGHAQAADIGLQGNQYKDADSYVDFFDIIVGTKVGDKPAKGIKIRTRIPAERAADEIGDLIRTFNENRRRNETFPDFSRRYFTDEGIEFQI